MEIIDIIILFIPLITGFLTGLIFNVGKSAGSSVKSRPPPIVFGIIWPILYLLIGWSWVSSRQKNKPLIDIMYVILIGLLCLWIIVYKYNKKLALYVLTTSLTSTLTLIVYNTNRDNRAAVLLVPLFTWLLFATMLNNTEVNQVV